MAKHEPVVRVSGFIDQDTTVNGDINFKESFRIDGQFKGRILRGQNLIIGENGEVEADINVGKISINGTVKGTIRANDMAEVFSHGRVMGQIMTPKLIIEEGAFFQGTCQMELKALQKGNDIPPEKSDVNITNQKDQPLKKK